METDLRGLKKKIVFSLVLYPLVYSLAITSGDSPLLLAGSYGSGLYRHPLSLATSVRSEFVEELGGVDVPFPPADGQQAVFWLRQYQKSPR